MLALAWGKAEKYKCLTGEEMPPPDQRSVIGQAKRTYFT